MSYSPRPVDSEGVIFFDSENRFSSPRPRETTDHSRHVSYEYACHSPSDRSVNPFSYNRPLSPTIQIGLNGDYESEDRSRSASSGFPHHVRTAQQHSEIAINSSHVPQTAQDSNTSVTCILSNITDVLTEMSSQLKSIKSIQTNTQNTQYNPRVQALSLEHSRPTSHVRSGCDVIGEAVEEGNFQSPGIMSDRRCQSKQQSQVRFAVNEAVDLDPRVQNTRQRNMGPVNEPAEVPRPIYPQTNRTHESSQYSMHRGDCEAVEEQMQYHEVDRMNAMNSRPDRLHTFEARGSFDNPQGCNRNEHNSNQAHTDLYREQILDLPSLAQPYYVGADRTSSRPQTSSVHQRMRDLGSLKISPYTGDGDWQVWIARFEAIAQRFRMTDDDKLDQLLPRLEGKAAQFAFTQLAPPALSNYRLLVRELNLRFRVIDTPKSYSAKFSRRSQKVGETAEDYAAELKMLYDKAHGHRDLYIRDEDLVRRFLDGLRDDEVRFEVEYYKEPESIDEAVFHVVNFIQTKGKREIERRPRNHARSVDEYESANVGRVNAHVKGRNADGHADAAQTSYTDQGVLQRDTDPELMRKTQGCTNPSATNANQADYAVIGALLGNIVERLERIEKSNQATRGDKARERKAKQRDDVECFNCHEIGHFARDCLSRQRQQGDSRRGKYNEGNNQPLNSNGPALAARGRSD